VVVSFLSTTTLVGSSMRTFMDSHLDDIHNGCVSGIRGVGGLTTVQPALWNISIWWQGLSGLDSTNPGPMMLKVASICIGLGSSKDNLWTRYPRSPRWRLIHSIPRLLVTWSDRGKIVKYEYHWRDSWVLWNKLKFMLCRRSAHPSVSVYVWLTDWPTGWLTDWLSVFWYRWLYILNKKTITNFRVSFQF